MSEPSGCSRRDQLEAELAMAKRGWEAAYERENQLRLSAESEIKQLRGDRVDVRFHREFDERERRNSEGFGRSL